MDIIKIKNSDLKANIEKLTPDSLQPGEMALIREVDNERLYIKNTDNEITPIHRVVDAGEFV